MLVSYSHLIPRIDKCHHDDQGTKFSIGLGAIDSHFRVPPNFSIFHNISPRSAGEKSVTEVTQPIRSFASLLELYDQGSSGTFWSKQQAVGCFLNC